MWYSDKSINSCEEKYIIFLEINHKENIISYKHSWYQSIKGRIHQS